MNIIRLSDQKTPLTTTGKKVSFFLRQKSDDLFSDSHMHEMMLNKLCIVFVEHVIAVPSRKGAERFMMFCDSLAIPAKPALCIYLLTPVFPSVIDFKNGANVQSNKFSSTAIF